MGGNGLREAKALGASRSCRASLGHQKDLGFTEMEPVQSSEWRTIVITSMFKGSHCP